MELALGLNPILHPGAYVYCTSDSTRLIPIEDILMFFRESEGPTMILKKEIADFHHLDYSNITSWIELGIQTSLDEVGITALFSTALAQVGISCNVVAAFYHDHIFVSRQEADHAMEILGNLTLDTLKKVGQVENQ